MKFPSVRLTLIVEIISLYIQDPHRLTERAIHTGQLYLRRFIRSFGKLVGKLFKLFKIGVKNGVDRFAVKRRRLHVKPIENIVTLAAGSERLVVNLKRQIGTNDLEFAHDRFNSRTQRVAGKHLFQRDDLGDRFLELFKILRLDEIANLTTISIKNEFCRFCGKVESAPNRAGVEILFPFDESGDDIVESFRIPFVGRLLHL